jgi:hypothetical protein
VKARASRLRVTIDLKGSVAVQSTREWEKNRDTGIQYRGRYGLVGYIRGREPLKAPVLK